MSTCGTNPEVEVPHSAQGGASWRVAAIRGTLGTFCRLSRKVAVMDVVKAAKTETSKWIKRQEPDLKDFSRQAGYGVFSVSQSNVEQVGVSSPVPRVALDVRVAHISLQPGLK